MTNKDEKNKELEKLEMMTLLGFNEFVCLDLETTSFTSVYGEIIEIGAVKIKDGIITEKFSTLVKPRKIKKIPAKITEITGISTEDVKDKPYMEDVLPELFKFIGGRVVICHNTGFDWDKMLTVFFKSLGIVANNKTIDTIKLAKLTLTDKKKGFKLGELCDYLGVELSNAHRALDDAIATAKVFLVLKNMNIGKFEELTYIEPVSSNETPNIQVKKVSYWVKEKPKAKTIEHERLYVNLFYNGKFTGVFLDMLNDIWYSNPKMQLTQTINMKEIEKACINFLRLKNREELLKYKN